MFKMDKEKKEKKFVSLYGFALQQRQPYANISGVTNLFKPESYLMGTRSTSFSEVTEAASRCTNIYESCHYIIKLKKYKHKLHNQIAKNINSSSVCISRCLRCVHAVHV